MKIQLLQNMSQNAKEDNSTSVNRESTERENDSQLIDLSAENTENPVQGLESSSNGILLNSKIEKMEQLVNKYKESLKSIKEKNSNMATELQILSNEIDNKKKENEALKADTAKLFEAQQKINELNMINEDLQNKINSYDFNRTKEISTLELQVQNYQEEIKQLQNKIDIFSKREEEYAISLAENKLSIHKELEDKESEIKTLKESLSDTKKELQSLNIITNDYKTSIAALEKERIKLNEEITELNLNKSKLSEMESQIQLLAQKCQSYEQSKSKGDEELKCVQLQMNQETAEKLAMIDRNAYLENRVTQLTEENSKKNNQVHHLENELQKLFEKDKNFEIQSNEVQLWKSKYNNLESEIQEEREELVKLQREIEKLLSNHESVQNKNLALQNTLSDINSENKYLRQKYELIKKKFRLLINEVKTIQKDIKSISVIVKPFKEEFNSVIIPEIKSKIVELCSFLEGSDDTKASYDILDIENNALKKELETIKNLHENNAQHMTTLTEENRKLTMLIGDYESKITLLEEEVQSLSSNFLHSTDELGILRNEKEKLIHKLQEVEILCNRLQNGIDHDKSQYLIALDKMKLLEDEKQTLHKRLNNLEKENELLNIEAEKLKVIHKDEAACIDVLNKEKQSINEKVVEYEIIINKLEQQIQELSHENTALKDQSTSIANRVKSLELEIEEIRKSHFDIEVEKDRLNSLIEDMQNKKEPISLSSENKDTQTEESGLKSKNDENLFDEASTTLEQSNAEELKSNDSLSLISTVEILTAKNKEYMEEINVLKDSNINLSNKLMEINSNVKLDNNNKAEENITEQYRTLCNSYDLLKEDNRRLRSDIEGLQTYLTKISKENCVLNDKLRETIAASDSSFGRSESNSTNNEFETVKSDVVMKEKIEDLIRENNLLLEENLELKDQLQSQNYVEPKILPDKKENDSITMDKYNNLLVSQSKLEEKLLNVEQINKLMNGNMQQMQNSNEKLKLTNEKLERRLDEALVSLRHLHSLQENTELEYLRNILYEYLTGSGTHSITLAKVLAAIVKFDDKQTQSVLQKEKERQGLLRQLGLL
ncbi:unnamed protein product [Diatraea saccharalis]|nr:unnamed protein product [Diatraea saccharalis]